jgi:hypothetical protein
MGELMASWYHLTYTLDTGATWKTVAPLPTWEHVVQYLGSKDFSLGVVHLEVHRFSDEPPHPGAESMKERG